MMMIMLIVKVPNRIKRLTENLKFFLMQFEASEIILINSRSICIKSR